MPRRHLDNGWLGQYVSGAKRSMEKSAVKLAVANASRNKVSDLTNKEIKARERNIASAYFSQTPTISNLYNGAKHWLSSVFTPNNNVKSVNYITGDAPVTPGFNSPSTIMNATDTGLALQWASDRYKNSKTIYSLLHKKSWNPDEEKVVRKAKEVMEFIKSKPYKERLLKYYSELNPGSIYNSNRVDDAIFNQLDNIGTAKINTYKDGYLWSTRGITDDAAGVYSTKDHIISVLKKYLYRDTPKHEMIHASDRGKPFLDNAKYKMRVKPGISDEAYYGDVAEQRPRVLNTLMDMEKQGFKINNLTQKDVDDYFDVPDVLLPSDAQSLLYSYQYDDILNALRNFKSVLPYVVVGGGAAAAANKYKNGGFLDNIKNAPNRLKKRISRLATKAPNIVYNVGNEYNPSAAKNFIKSWYKGRVSQIRKNIADTNSYDDDWTRQMANIDEHTWHSSSETLPKNVSNKLTAWEKDVDHVEGMTIPKYRVIYFNQPNTKKMGSSIQIHEGTHSQIPIVQIRAMEDKIHLKPDVYPDSYYDDPDEINSRLMEFRYSNKLNPRRKYTIDEIRKMDDTGNGGATWTRGRRPLDILNRYDDKTLLFLINDLASNKLPKSNGTYIARNGGTIHINPKNRGKFNALKRRTGKTTEQLTHSKNPLTRKRAIFAQNAAKWKH